MIARNVRTRLADIQKQLRHAALTPPDAQYANLIQSAITVLELARERARTVDAQRAIAEWTRLSEQSEQKA